MCTHTYESLDDDDDDVGGPVDKTPALGSQIKAESPVEAGSSRQGSRRKLVSGHLVGQLAGRERLSDVRFADGLLAVDGGVVVIAATGVIIGLRMLGGQVLPESGLPGELGLASGAGNLHVGPR